MMDRETLTFSAILCGSISVVAGLLAITTGFAFFTGMAAGVGIIALIDGLFAFIDRDGN